MAGRLIGALHRIEEGLLAFLLAAMTIVTFSQVVARYVFNTGAIWALELTTFLFAWLVILGISYGIRVRAPIGVDVRLRTCNSVAFFGPSNIGSTSSRCRTVTESSIIQSVCST